MPQSNTSLASDITYNDVPVGPLPSARPWDRPERFLKLLDDPWFQLLVGLQHEVSAATFNYWARRHCGTIHLPITTHAISSPMGLGSDSLPVEINLFGEPTYLADSMQFMLEYGCRLNPAGCFYLMPSFRGEAADPTHLCQFYHSEVELCVGLDEAISVADDYIRDVTAAIAAKFGDQLSKLRIGTQHLEQLLARRSTPRLTFAEVAAMLGESSQWFRRVDYWKTLTRSGEAELIARMGGPVWVTHWDHATVPFYQAYDDNPQRARNADLLLGFGEVIGLGERHRTGDQVLRALEDHSISIDPYRWYVDMKAVKPLLTSGFGMGVERYLLWVLRHDDIRDLQLLPRFNGQSIVP